MKKTLLIFPLLFLTSVLTAQALWQVGDAYSIASDMVRYCPATGKSYVNWMTNMPRVAQYDSDGTWEWEHSTNFMYSGYASISDDGSQGICCDNTLIHVLDMSKGESLRQIDVGSYVCALMMRHDGAGFFVGCGTNAAGYEIRYYPIENDEPSWRIEGIIRCVLDFAMPADDSRLIATYNAGIGKIWVIDPLNGEVIQDDIPYYDNTPNQAPALSAHGEYLVYTDFNGKAYLYAWDGQRYQKQWEANVTGPGYSTCWGNANAISADGSLIAIGTHDQTSTSNNGAFYVFSKDSPVPLWSYQNMGDAVVQAAISDDGSRIACVTWGPMDHSKADFYLFSSDSNQPLFELNTQGSLMCLDMSPDGSRCLVGGKAVHTRETGLGGMVYLLDISADGVVELQQEPKILVNNPVADELILSSELNITGTIQIIDLHGRVILESTGFSTNAPIYVNHLSPGIYMARIQRDNLNTAIKFLKL